MKRNSCCIPRWCLYSFCILLFTVSVNEAIYNFTIRFYEFRTIEVHRRECTNIQLGNCDIRFRFILRPYGASVDTAPSGNLHFPYFTPRGGNNTETFIEGSEGFLGLPNPFTITNYTDKWTGRIQIFIDAVTRKVRFGVTATNIINRFAINLELNLGPNFTEKEAYSVNFFTTQHDKVELDMSFRVQCLENYYGPNCTTFCKPLEGVYTCDSEVCNNPDKNISSGCIQCLHLGYDPNSNCSDCLLPGYDPSQSCKYCLPRLDLNSNCSQSLIPMYDVTTYCTGCSLLGYDPSTNCSICLPGRDLSTNCMNCSFGYDPSTNCSTCLPGRDLSTYCIECSFGYDPSTSCSTCLLGRDLSTNCTVCSFGYNPSTNCSTCLPGKDMSTYCIECNFGYDPLINCSTCLPGRNLSTNCTKCSIGYDPSTNCSTCLTGRDLSTNCTNCSFGYDPSTTCFTCLPGRDINSGCTECFTGFDVSTGCSECEIRKLDPSTGCTLCLQRGQDPLSNCTECLPNYDPNTKCSNCLVGWDISTGCARCQPNRNISNSCRTCNNRSVLIGSVCISVDPCISKPCQNGGTCVALYALTAAGYHCQCKPGYGGLLCEFQQNNNTIQYDAESVDSRKDIESRSNSVVILGGALGGFVGLLIFVCIILIVVIVYLGRELKRRQNHNIIINKSRKQTSHGEQTFLQETVGTLDTNNSEVAHTLHNPLYDCAEVATSTTLSSSQKKRTTSNADDGTEEETKPEQMEAAYDVVYPPKPSSAVVEGAVYDVPRQPQEQPELKQGGYNVTVHPVNLKKVQAAEISEYAYAGIDIVQPAEDSSKAVGSNLEQPKYDYADTRVLMQFAKTPPAVDAKCADSTQPAEENV